MLSQEVMKGLEEEIDEKNVLIETLVLKLVETQKELGDLKGDVVDLTAIHERELRVMQQRLSFSQAQHRLAQNAIAKHIPKIRQLQRRVNRFRTREAALAGGIYVCMYVCMYV